jgi:hypothetical protein
MAPPWKQIYNLFDPMQKLDAKTLTRFVPRDGDQIETIATDLRFADGPHHALVVGQRGTGKSSELRVLAHQLLSEFFVIVVDVDEQSDIFNVNHVEVLYLLGTAIFAAARVRGLTVPDSLLEALTGSIQTLVRTRTDSKDYAVPVKEIFAAIATAAAAATDPSLGAAVLHSAATIFKDLKFNLGISDNAVSRLEVKPQIANISAALNQIVDAVRRASDRPLLVIVDGLDRVEFTQGRQIFAESQLLDAPACHMLYVIPAHLYYSPHLSAARQVFGQVYPLPNVKLRGRNGEPSPRGYELMRQVIDRRLQEVGCRRDDVFTPEALDLLIENSGGMMREFMRLTQNAVRDTVIHQHLRVERDDAEGVVDALRRDLAAGITVPLMAELVGVLQQGKPSGTELSNLALQNQYVLCQANKDIWYEVHPVLASLVNAEWVAHGEP